MATEKRMSEDTLLLLHIIHKDNPMLSGGNWPALGAKMGQPADRLRPHFLETHAVPNMPLDSNHVLLLRLLARENPSLSMNNGKELCEEYNLSLDTTKKRFAAMRKEFMESADNTAQEAPAPRKRGRPPKNSKSDANGDAKPKAKRARTASANKAAAKSDGYDSDASEPPAAVASKNSKKTKVTKEDADAADMAPASDDDDA